MVDSAVKMMNQRKMFPKIGKKVRSNVAWDEKLKDFFPGPKHEIWTEANLFLMWNIRIYDA